MAVTLTVVLRLHFMYKEDKDNIDKMLKKTYFSFSFSFSLTTPQSEFFSQSFPKNVPNYIQYKKE